VSLSSRRRALRMIWIWSWSWRTCHQRDTWQPQRRSDTSPCRGHRCRRLPPPASLPLVHLPAPLRSPFLVLSSRRRVARPLSRQACASTTSTICWTLSCKTLLTPRDGSSRAWWCQHRLLRRLRPQLWCQPPSLDRLRCMAPLLLLPSQLAVCPRPSPLLWPPLRRSRCNRAPVRRCSRLGEWTTVHPLLPLALSLALLSLLVSSVATLCRCRCPCRRWPRHPRSLPPAVQLRVQWHRRRQRWYRARRQWVRQRAASLRMQGEGPRRHPAACTRRGRRQRRWLLHPPHHDRSCAPPPPTAGAVWWTPRL
jgi:hypothetical protein